jgi:hypothetical protein
VTHSQAGNVQVPISGQADQIGAPGDGDNSAESDGWTAELPVQHPRERRWYPRLSTGTSATQQRNTTQYAGAAALPNGTDRFVYGGYRSYAFERPIPLTRDHLRRKAGAGGYDGSRYYAPNTGMGAPGAVGKSRDQKKRPTIWVEPAPWSANQYDTTAGSGTPNVPGNVTPVTQVYVSPDVRTNTNGGTWRRG